MQKVIGLVFALIALFLVVYYYKGSSEVLTAGGNAFRNLTDSLQGKNKVGNLPTSYPK